MYFVNTYENVKLASEYYVDLDKLVSLRKEYQFEIDTLKTIVPSHDNTDWLPISYVTLTSRQDWERDFLYELADLNTAWASKTESVPVDDTYTEFEPQYVIYLMYEPVDLPEPEPESKNNSMFAVMLAIGFIAVTTYLYS